MATRGKALIRRLGVTRHLNNDVLKYREERLEMGSWYLLLIKITPLVLPSQFPTNVAVTSWDVTLAVISYHIEDGIGTHKKISGARNSETLHL